MMKTLTLLKRFIIFPGLVIIFPLYAQIREDTAMKLRSSGRFDLDQHPGLQNSLFMLPDTLPLLPWVEQDFMINDLAGDYGAEQWWPAIAADSSGNYAATWTDQRNNKPEIYIQFFNNRDEPIGNNILVNDQEWGNIYGSPVIAANKRGDFVVVWIQTSYRLMAQIFSNTGIKIGENIEVDETGSVINSDPALAIAEDGRFLVSWSGAYVGDIYSCLFDTNVNSISNMTVLNDITGKYGLYSSSHSVAVDDQGNFVVVWRQWISNISKIFLQQLDNFGIKTGHNIIVSDSTDTRRHYDPAVTATNDGYFFIVWNSTDPENINGGTTARMYSSTGQFVTGQIIISGNNSVSYSDLLAGNRKDTFWIFKFSQSSGMIQGQKISKLGELQGEAIIRKLDPIDSLYIYDMSVAELYTDRFCITFLQYHRGDTEVFTQRYDSSLLPLNEPVKTNMDQFSSYQNNPLVCFNQQGGSIVLWDDRRNGRYDLYAQVYDSVFNPVGENMQINDLQAEYWLVADKKADALSDGTFIIVFCHEYPGNVYLQAVSSQGYKINTNILVKELYHQRSNLELKVDLQDQILLCWYDEYSAYMRKYNRNLVSVSMEKGLYSYNQNYYYQPVTLSINKDLHIFISWKYRTSKGSYNEKLYGLLYDQAGKVISDTMIIDTGVYYLEYLTLDNYLTDAGDYVVVWCRNENVNIWRKFTTGQSYIITNSVKGADYNNSGVSIVQSKNYKTLITYSSGSDIRGYFFDDNKRQVQSCRLCRYESSTHGNGQFYHAAIFNDKLFFTFESNKHGETGIDIWGNVQSLAGINFEPDKFRPPPGDDILYPSFPNPFNAVTRIAYDLLAFHKVKLTVYDIIGREVKVLVDQYQEKGYYEVEFDAAALASGIYFCRLEAFRTQVKKLMLIK